MENASDALKMAFAVFVFVSAVGLAILSLTKARQAATAVFSRTDERFYATDDKTQKERIVGIETVIPTLYSNYKEGYTILFYSGNVDADNNLVGDITPLTLYYSEAYPKDLKNSYLMNMSHINDVFMDNGNRLSRAIYGLDTQDETNRNEAWVANPSYSKSFIQSYVTNQPAQYNWSREAVGTGNQRNNQNKITYKFDGPNTLIEKLGGPLSKATGAQFIERMGVYNLDNKSDVPSSEENRSENPSIIEFSNGEQVENEEGTQKRVIQYIYIGKK